MLEANGFAWADVCLTVPGKLRDRDAIAGPSAEVGAALATAAARAASKGGRALAARLQGMMETRTDRKAFIRIGPENAGTAGLPGPPDSRPETPGRKRQRRRAAAEAKEREMTERDTG
ncbi:MAG: hypothetical protein OXG44_00205, partial [Gammaproteobacteria bacterium]|nr:hypothetical protein [Gammaproteobacteria bacterium]